MLLTRNSFIPATSKFLQWPEYEIIEKNVMMLSPEIPSFLLLPNSCNSWNMKTEKIQNWSKNYDKLIN